MEQLRDWLVVVAALGGVGLLGGIFARLGAVVEAVGGLKERVASLEGWRNLVMPWIKIG